MAQSGARNLRLKRIYDAPEAGDGCRVLVDRVWPRGLSKRKAEVDLWLKDIAPSTDLRKWFDHTPGLWKTFRSRYFKELDENPEPVAELRERLRQGRVMLLFAARDEAHNNAVALGEYLANARRRK